MPPADLIAIEKDGWRAEPLPEDFTPEPPGSRIGAICTYCEDQGHRVFLQVEIDERMQPVWSCSKAAHRFPHSEQLVRIAGSAFAQLLADTLRRRHHG